jgi:hypothetical protein
MRWKFIKKFLAKRSVGRLRCDCNIKTLLRKLGFERVEWIQAPEEKHY